MAARTEPRRILFVGPVFPEPTSSAAGVRTVALIEDFLSRGDRILFASPSDRNAFAERLEARGIATVKIGPNDPAFDAAVREFAPDVALFDRFMLEEQFGWRVAEAAPNALRILDTIDLHFLRRWRGERLAGAIGKRGEGAPVEAETLAEIAEAGPGIETEDCLRELAAILRSDLTLVLSRFEMRLLAERFRIDPALLLFHGFAYPPPSAAEWRSHSERRHFVSIGNFRHLPNRDATFWLARELWPRIRAKLRARGENDVELHLYGAYPPREIMALDSPREGLRVFGPVADAIEALRDYRAVLAPLRFGAGIKGKIADAWAAGVPVVTTPIGAEGMEEGEGSLFAGAVARNADEFAGEALDVYRNEERGRTLRDAGAEALAKNYGAAENRRAFLERVDALLAEPGALAAHRARNVFGRVLRSEAFGRTKYFSKWIEEKNKIVRHED
ncbi:MAG: glycosyltransferase [Bdellovibrionales bacterium]|nr:glycosyltransferase [Bdellovibrionales bacterium]